MNRKNSKNYAKLKLCPRCGMDSGTRIVTDTNPENLRNMRV